MPRTQPIAALRPRDGSDTSSTPAVLARELLTHHDARLLSEKPHGLLVAIDAGEGRNVFVMLAPREIQLEATIESELFFDEEHGTEEEDPDVNEPVLDVADAIVRRLQVRTGWEVESEHLSGFDRLECPSCEGPCFEWQDQCSVCGAWLDEPEDSDDEDPPPDPEDELAQSIVRHLVQAKLLELVTPASEAPLCSRLAAHLVSGWASPESILDLLVEFRGVAEVYASEDDVARLLDR